MRSILVDRKRNVVYNLRSLRVVLFHKMAAFGLSSKMIICDVVVIKTIFKPEHQKTFRAIPERVCELFHKK